MENVFYFVEIEYFYNIHSRITNSNVRVANEDEEREIEYFIENLYSITSNETNPFRRIRKWKY